MVIFVYHTPIIHGYFAPDQLWLVNITWKIPKVNNSWFIHLCVYFETEPRCETQAGVQLCPELVGPRSDFKNEALDPRG